MTSTRSRSIVRISAIAALLVALVLAPMTRASTRPQYGGTLRIELHVAGVELDPRKWKPGSQDLSASEHLAALLFDRLVVLDNYGRFHPQLAVEWTHDAAFKRWQFALRSGVKFSDGATFTPADVAASLRTALPATIQINAFNNSVLFQSATSVPDMLEILASGRSFIFRQAADGTLVGTAPFALVTKANSDSDAPASPAKLRFRAQEQAWAGRPFVDHIDVTLGVPPLRALFDLQLGKADIVLLAPEIVRRAVQSDIRIWESDPVTLYLLLADPAAAPTSDARFREALSLSLDRGTMAGVLLQKQAEPSASLLPQWLSGYALLFNMDLDLTRAQELQRSLPGASAGSTEALLLRVEVPGDLARLVGDRVAVNARQAGLFLQAASRPAADSSSARTSAGSGKIPLRLLSWRYTSLSPRAELEMMASSLHLESRSESDPAVSDSLASVRDIEQLYSTERSVLEKRIAIPLVAFPDYVALSPAVRDWTPGSWGEWRLADVWLSGPRDNAAEKQSAASSTSPSSAGARP